MRSISSSTCCWVIAMPYRWQLLVISVRLTMLSSTSVPWCSRHSRAKSSRLIVSPLTSAATGIFLALADRRTRRRPRKVFAPRRWHWCAGLRPWALCRRRWRCRPSSRTAPTGTRLRPSCRWRTNRRCAGCLGRACAAACVFAIHGRLLLLAPLRRRKSNWAHWRTVVARGAGLYGQSFQQVNPDRGV